MLVNIFIVIAENSDLEKTFCDIIRNEDAFATCMPFDQLIMITGISPAFCEIATEAQTKLGCVFLFFLQPAIRKNTFIGEKK